MLVVWQHSSEIFNRVPEISANGTLLADIAWSVDFGRIGVVCFFLISGFVIPFSFSTEEGALKKFVIRRFFRLYPVYWASIAIALITAFFLSGNIFGIKTVLANITMLQKFFSEQHIQGLYWTLQVEVIFYCLCAFMYAFGILHNPTQQFLACILSLIIFCAFSVAVKKVSLLNGFDKELQYVPYTIAIMFSGTILRVLLLGEKFEGRKIFLLIAPLLVFSIPVAVLFLHLVGVNIMGQPIRFFCGHIFGLALFLFGFYKFTLEVTFLLWLGTVSYSIYLFHPIAVKLVFWAARQDWAVHFSSLHMSVYILLVFILTFIVAFFTYNIIERRSIKLGRRLTAQS